MAREKNFLHTIIEERAKDARTASAKISMEFLQKQAAERTEKLSLRARLSHGLSPHIIAEVKKASPSAGVISEHYEPARIAQEYERHGADCVSVLTEPRYFMGSNDDLRAVRNAVGLPVLRKDFICDPYQIYESAALGADVILLICAALDFNLVEKLYKIALAAGLEALVETHTEDEIKNALKLEEAIIGVNSRNLKTLKTDLAVARNLACHIPSNRLAVAESGIKNRAEIEELSALGYNGFLIGESLLKTSETGLKSIFGAAPDS